VLIFSWTGVLQKQAVDSAVGGDHGEGAGNKTNGEASGLDTSESSSGDEAEKSPGLFAAVRCSHFPGVHVGCKSSCRALNIG